ncbi:hypothetical protein QCA50_009861 [Cerrena zonata]|uniref:Uncharacterized protein n=1 Tax=Cerrena zonata TaxID=2478898 RepID=A0AAW0G003_9APHY
MKKDEMKLLNVLQLEIENSEEEPKAFNDEYFEKYPWAKFFHEDESEEGEEEEKEEGDESYDDNTVEC